MDSESAELARENDQKIRGKFAGLLINVCQKLQNGDINVEDLRLFVIAFCPRGNCIPKSSNVHEIFEEITRHGLWSYLHYYLLEQIVEKFGSCDQEMKTWITNYKNDLLGYKASMKIMDFISVVQSDSSFDDSDSEEESPVKSIKYDRRYFRKLSVKLKVNITNQSLLYIESLWESFADYFLLPPLAAMLECIHTGCILVVWYIPSNLVPQIRQKAPQASDFFREHKIVCVKVGNTSIYEDELFSSELKDNESQIVSYILCESNTMDLLSSAKLFLARTSRWWVNLATNYQVHTHTYC